MGTCSDNRKQQSMEQQKQRQSDIVIENDSKEVLLRMFEHLISKEEAADGLSSSKLTGCKGRRETRR